MKKMVTITILVLISLAAAVPAQEIVVTDFPLGIGRSVPDEFFVPYYPQLQALADSLAGYPNALAVVTGSSDGNRYSSQNDAKNPSLALGRAHALRDVLVFQFGVDSSQVVVQTKEVNVKGGQYRFARVRIVMEQVKVAEQIKDLVAKVQQPPIEKHFTEIREVPGQAIENMGMKFAAGISSSPFGVMPVFSGALTWKQIFFIEGEFGHTIWNRNYTLENVEHNTKRRMAAGYFLAFPFESIPVGALAGWVRTEEVSQSFHKYVRLAEGPTVGVRYIPIKYIAITGAYHPIKERVADQDAAKVDNGQFSLSITGQIVFGGQR